MPFTNVSNVFNVFRYIKNFVKNEKAAPSVTADRTARPGKIDTPSRIHYTTSYTIFQLVHPSVLLEPLNLLVKRDGKVSYLTFLVLA